jgi:localization factor PodJL
MKTATAQSGRAGERSAHKIAEKMAKSAGLALDDWIADAIQEYADDLGVEPRSLNERERLEAIEERIDRLARSGPPQRMGEIDDGPLARRPEAAGRLAEYDDSARRRRNEFDDDPRSPHRNRRPRDADLDAAEPDRLEEAVERIERRAVRALESLAGLAEARRGERERLEAAIERIGRRAELSEARTARALEPLLASARPAAPAGSRRPPAQSDDAVAARLDALARRAAGAPSAQAEAAAARNPPGEDDETLRLVAERLARRRKQRQEAAATRGDDAAPKDPAIARMERELSNLAERVERAAGVAPALDSAARAETDRSAASMQGLELRLDELGRQIEATAQRPAAEAGLMEELARRVEAIRVAVERQEARPEGPALLAALADLNDKLDRASASGSQSAATMTALQGMIGRLEEAMQHPTPAPIDPRPIEELARRIEGVRGLVERQDALVPKVEQIRIAVGELREKLDRPASSAAETERLEAALRQLSADVHALARAGAPDMRPVEDLARRIEAMRKAMEGHAELAPQVERLERSLAEIAARLDRPAKSPQIEAVDATLRQIAAKFEEAVGRPATVALDTRPIEDLARRIESVRESLEKPPALAPQVERLETALGAMSEKLDRVQPIIEAQNVNSTLAEMNARLEEAFRRPAQVEIDTQPIKALAAQVEAVRETVERQAEQLDVVGRPIDEFGKRLDTLREAIERQARQLDIGRLQEAVRDAVETLDRPAIGPEEFRAIVAAIQALAAKIDGGASAANAAREDVLERIAERLDRPGVEPADIAALAGAVVELSAKIERPPLDISRLEAIAAQAAARPDPAGDLAALADAVAKLGAKLDRNGAAQAQAPYHDFVARLAQFEARLAAARPADEHFAHLESEIGELAEKLNDFTAAADTRAVEQELRVLQEKLDDLADARMSNAFAEQTAQAVARALGERPEAGNPEALLGPLQDLQDRVKALASMRPSPAALEQTMIELTEELEAFRSAREAVSRGAATLSEIRAEQLQFDRRMDARFLSVQEILEKLVDRLNGGAQPAARPAEAPAAAQTALLDIPDRSASETRPTAPPSLDAGQIGQPARARDGAEGAKAAAINAHIAAARRAANAAAADGERREEADKARKGAEVAFSGWTQRAGAAFQQHRRPVLLGAAGLMALLTGVAVLEMRGHAPVRKSELEAPATPLAQAPSPVAGGADMAPTGAIVSPPKVTSSPLPPAKAAPTPSAAMIASLPAGVGAALAAAGAQGDVGAEVEIAQRYLEGRDVPRDPKAAAAWMQEAAEAGNAFAQYRLGAMYEKGVGVARDAAHARELYTKAASAGNARAMHNLAVLYAQDGGAGKPDYAAALEWFRKAAEYGVRDSQFNLGVLYGRGLGGPQDLAQSWMWFSIAARQGDADAARKRDEVANRMDGAAMASAQKLLDAFKAKTPDPAVNTPPPVPAAAAANAPAEGKAAGVKG